LGDQHRLADDERRSRGDHEAGEGDGVLGEDQIRRQYDQAEADKEEDRRRQHLPQLVQKPGARPAAEPGRWGKGIDVPTAVIIRDGFAPHRFSPGYAAAG
jgi:hypothetical protein